MSIDLSKSTENSGRLNAPVIQEESPPDENKATFTEDSLCPSCKNNDGTWFGCNVLGATVQVSGKKAASDITACPHYDTINYSSEDKQAK